MMNKKLTGYFTVEAVILLPFVIWIIGLVMYLMIFQYNRCLMEQDLGMIFVRSAGFSLPSEELIKETDRLKDGINYDKYVSCRVESVNVEKKITGFEISGELTIDCPIAGVGDIGKQWHAERKFTGMKLSPVYFIRMCNKVADVTGRKGN